MFGQEELGISHELAPDGGQDHGGSKLRVDPLAHDALKADASTYETEPDETEGIGPVGVTSA